MKKIKFNVALAVISTVLAAPVLAGEPLMLAQVDPMSMIENSLVNSLTQNVVGSVLNGQIGSQLSQGDQSYRLQQYNNLLQSGNFSQSQQWVSPQGNSINVSPVGQMITHPQTQQQCQNLQETVTLPNGQTITENRQACQDPQTGQWALTQ